MSLAIVWGTTLERIKFGVYILYAIVFAAFIYPIASHWVFGGGWLQVNVGMQDFAGSTAVHLIGATGALAALLLLGAAPRQVRHGRQAARDPGPQHAAVRPRRADPVARLVRLQRRARRSTRRTGASPRSSLVTQLAAAARRARRAIDHRRLEDKSIDIGMAGNGAIGALVAITAPSGYVELWAARSSAPIAGVIVAAVDATRSTSGSTTRSARCRRTASRASGARWRAASSRRRGWRSTTGSAIRTAACSTRARSTQLGRPGARLSPSSSAFVFVLSFGDLLAHQGDATGCASRAEEEDAGLDISEHGMYGYPEQFIPAPELIGYGVASSPRSGLARRRHHHGGPAS